MPILVKSDTAAEMLRLAEGDTRALDLLMQISSLPSYSHDHFAMPEILHNLSEIRLTGPAISEAHELIGAGDLMMFSEAIIWRSPQLKEFAQAKESERKADQQFLANRNN